MTGLSNQLDDLRPIVVSGALFLINFALGVATARGDELSIKAAFAVFNFSLPKQLAITGRMTECARPSAAPLPHLHHPSHSSPLPQEPAATALWRRRS